MSTLRLLAFVAAGAAGCIARDRLVCSDDAQCTLRSGGSCVAGGCAYPDGACPSGLRYSELAGELAESCVPMEQAGGSTTSVGGVDSGGDATSSGDDTTSSGVPSPCDGIECSGAGRCVVVDDAPTCACAPGEWMIDLSCLADPCDHVSCWYVDDVTGDDMAAGTIDAPWRTLGRLSQALATAQPGDHFLLRRGGTWGDPDGGHRLYVDGTHGTAEAPVVIGGYGPLDDGRPRILPGNVLVRDASDVVLRDLHVQDDPDDPDLAVLFGNRPCVMIERSDHVTVVDTELTGCNQRGIFAYDGSSYLTVVDNVVHGVDSDGIAIIDTTWTDPIVRVGHHHWVLDNRVYDVTSAGISVGVQDPSAAIGDVKVVRNRVADSQDGGISVATAGFAWVADNLVARTHGSETWQAALRLNAGGAGQLSGNIAFETGVGGLVIENRVDVVANTVVHDGGVGDALALDDNAQLTASNNLLWARDGRRVLAVWSGTTAEHVTALDRQWYVGVDDAACSFADAGGVLDFAAWVAATGLDATSRCAPMPGFADFATGIASEAWDEAFLAAFTPPSDWAACDAPIGARDCDGTPIGPPPQPLPDYDESAGRGWAGPLLVRQRYDLAP